MSNQTNMLLSFLLAFVIAHTPPPKEDHSEEVCRDLNFAVATGSSLCTLAVIAFPNPASAIGCTVGVTVSTLSVRSICFWFGHLTPQKFPPIAVRMANGTIMDMDGSMVHNIESGQESRDNQVGRAGRASPMGATGGNGPVPDGRKSQNSRDATIVKRNVFQGTVINWPTLGQFPLTSDLLISIGAAADNKTSCPTEGHQRCIDGTRAFLTCTSGNQWIINQACGLGTMCTAHPTDATRILCDFTTW